MWTTEKMTDIDAETKLLRYCARLPGGRAGDPPALSELRHWDSWVQHAEQHGLSPLAYAHLHRCPELPEQVRLALRALALRHRHANRVRFDVLAEILDAFAARRIETVVLKGAALAHTLYPEPGLRPMRDLDLLVLKSRRYDAREALRALGFDADAQAPTPYMSDHHHLPNAALVREGLKISVEIHDDALSRDAPESITLGRLGAPLRPFQMLGRMAYAFGHVDMLCHLCRHLLEPAAEVRLISVVDIVEYAARHEAEIDWTFLARQHPFVPATLALLGYIVPLPPGLVSRIPPAPVPPPEGVAQCMLPLSQILLGRVRWRELFRRIFYPSDWWLHAYYGVSLGRSLGITRWTRHPVHVAFWLYRRWRAGMSAT